MKKLIMLVLAGILLTGGAMTAYALPSPGSPGVISPEGGKDKDGNEVDVEIVDLPPEDLPDEEKDLIGKVEVVVPGDKEGPFEIVINVPGADDSLVVYQKKDGVWETVGSTIREDGMVVVLLDGSVPLAFYMDPKTAVFDGTSDARSPKTGMRVFDIWSVLLLLAAAGMTLTYTKPEKKIR